MKTVELFAGVGGFRLGLEQASDKFVTVYANQWEPNKKKQYAYENYCSHWIDHNCINEDIAKIKDNIPYHDLLTFGFPCQDYSVNTTNAKGIEGKKGVLWWHIRDILESKKPKYALGENVDRLLKSPSKQKGRDFGIILKCFADLGYSVQWRVINAADYGNAQKRKRVFIFASLDNLPRNPVINGVLGKAFPITEYTDTQTISLPQTIQETSDNFTFNFLNSGYMEKGIIYTTEVTPKYEKVKPLKDICFDSVKEKYYLKNETLEKWKYLKGSKRIPRVKPNGESYFYTEGKMDFPDNLDKPARTILTSEGSINRSSHVIKDSKGLRILIPVECERIQGFPDNWTKGLSERMRYFVMGNSLVVPLVTRIGKVLIEMEI